MTPQTHPIDKEQVMAYLDGELAPEQASRVAIHLEQCAECRELAENLRKVSSQMLAWSIEAPPNRMGEAVMVALDKHDKQETSGNASSMLSSKILWKNLM